MFQRMRLLSIVLPVTACGACADDQALSPAEEVNETSASLNADDGRRWAPIGIDPGISIDGFVSDVYGWRDSRNRPRSIALVRNDAVDPAGYYGGYVRRYTYARSDGSTLRAVGGHVAEHPGWGYTVHHQNDLGDAYTLSSRRAAGRYRVVFKGEHHAMHEYSWTVLRTQGDVEGGIPQEDKPITTTIRWLVATGKDHPTWAHTVDTTAMGPNTFFADDRAPYGELAFDGVDGDVSGVGWGDRYRFTTTSSPLSMDATWDYTRPNRVPYAHLWTDAPNAEMGSVQTWDWQHMDAGYGWLYPNWGRTSANKIISDGTPATPNMPAEWNWTFQLNQWEMSYGDTASKRLGWGTNYGSVGQTSYPNYGDDGTLSGYPFHVRSVQMVLGPKGSVIGESDAIARMLDMTITAWEGTVRTSGPKGFGAAATVSQSYAPAGYNPLYGTFELDPGRTGAFIGTIATAGGPASDPIFRLHGWRSRVPKRIILGGEVLSADKDFFASLVSTEGPDTETELWITIRRSVRGPAVFIVAPEGWRAD